MKAELKIDGTLLVTAETETESFALARWAEEFYKIYSGESMRSNFAATVMCNLYVDGAKP